MASTQGAFYDLLDRFRKDLADRERAAASAMVQAYGKAWQTIQGKILSLTTQYYEAVQAGEIPSVSWLYEANRLQALRGQVEAEIRKYSDFSETTILTGQRDAVMAAREQAMELISSAAEATGSNEISASFNRLPVSAFESLVGSLQNGSPLRALLNQLPGDAGNEVADALTNGLALGRNPKDIAAVAREALGGNLVRSLRISRTEIVRAYREATRQTYQANGDVVNGWIWRSARSDRTCAMCWAMDGTEHTVDEILDDHPCGLCFMVPKTKSWEELGFKGVTEPEPILSDTGAEAFNQLDDDRQLTVLGPAKYAAYKDEAIELEDLVGRKYDASWGWMHYEKSLVDVLGAEQAKAYTSLALMGVAKNAGNYSVDDLVKVAGLGIRDLAGEEIEKIVKEAAIVGFDEEANSVVSNALAGLEWDGNVLQKGDLLSPDINHYLKHVVMQGEWPAGTTLDEYQASLKEVITDPNSGIMISKYKNSYWQVTFYNDSGSWQGPHGNPSIVVEFRTGYGRWVTGFQPKDLDKQLLEDRSSNHWVRKK